MEGLIRTYKSVVYVAYYDINSNLVCTPFENWDTSREGAVGVVVIEGSKRLLVALDGTTLFFGSNLGIGNAVVTTDSQKAFGDYNGQSNTSNIISSDSFSQDGADYAPGYCHAYSKGNKAAGTWWLPSLGELGIIWKYFEPINAALERINGAVKLVRGQYLSSTDVSEKYAWSVQMNFGSLWYSEKTQNKLNVRPVSNF